MSQLIFCHTLYIRLHVRVPYEVYCQFCEVAGQKEWTATCKIVPHVTGLHCILETDQIYDFFKVIS